MNSSRQQNAGGDKDISDGAQNKRNEGSVIEGKEEEDVENMSMDPDKAQKELPYSKGKPTKNVAEMSQDDKSYKEEVSSSAEEMNTNITREESEQEADEMQKSDSEIDGEDAYGEEPDISDAKRLSSSADLEISDDEPLVNSSN